MKRSLYYDQVRLLLSLIPFIQKYPTFALKGGTAINFFYQNMLRLSVDIDLTWLPIEDRNISLSNISSNLQVIKDLIQKRYPSASIQVKKDKSTDTVISLLIQAQKTIVKIETNHIMRGTVFKPVTKQLTSAAEEMFHMTLSTQVLAYEDLYGGKVCAALDRQHPRDLFDIKTLLETKGISKKIRLAFIAYLLSHPRPIAELLQPNIKDIRSDFDNHFTGMTSTTVTCQELIDTRSNLIESINKSLTDKKNYLSCQ